MDELQNKISGILLSDAHCHVDFPRESTVSKRLVCAAKEEHWDALSRLPQSDIPFFGIHPWHIDQNTDLPSIANALRKKLAAIPKAGVGEIGLDRLRDKNISSLSRNAFTLQLSIAKEFHRPAVLHGAKCWGEVVKECKQHAPDIPAFLFHGFSRSAGLIPDIIKINGFISVTASVLNDHAVNYRDLVKELPITSLLIETDGEAANAAELPPISAIYDKVAALRKISVSELAAQTEANLRNFLRFQ